jgi:S-adenosylmethionine:tRNA ribosyltransferase-isomerase
MRTELFDFELPDDRIALEPASPRDAARLLVVKPGPGAIDDAPRLSDLTVRDLPALLGPGDALVLNDTRVIPAALEGRRVRGDLNAKVTFNLLKRVAPDRWRALARPAKKLEIGDRVVFAPSAGALSASQKVGDVLPLPATVTAKGEAGEVELVFGLGGAALDAAIAAVGAMPLPPYIAGKRAPDARDRASYQTIFAMKDGAVAAPTAGLHFTPDLFATLDERGISRHFVTLHVGAGTFLPVKVDDTREHKMHAEWGEVSASTAAALNAVHARGGRIVAVGTTSLRLLESATDEAGQVRPWSGETAIFITPGYRFRAVDVLMTNFHLPRSTLFMLVAAFSGLETMRAAYAHAIREGYRFYSYGDACLLDRQACRGK